MPNDPDGSGEDSESEQGEVFQSSTFSLKDMNLKDLKEIAKGFNIKGLANFRLRDKLVLIDKIIGAESQQRQVEANERERQRSAAKREQRLQVRGGIDVNAGNEIGNANAINQGVNENLNVHRRSVVFHPIFIFVSAMLLIYSILAYKRLDVVNDQTCGDENMYLKIFHSTEVKLDTSAKVGTSVINDVNIYFNAIQQTLLSNPLNEVKEMALAPLVTLKICGADVVCYHSFELRWSMVVIRTLETFSFCESKFFECLDRVEQKRLKNEDKDNEEEKQRVKVDNEHKIDSLKQGM